MRRSGLVAIFLIASTMTWADEECPEWYEGGTLFEADNEEWESGTARDRLATSAIWAYSAIEDMSPAIESTDELFSFAVQIRNCLSTAVEGISLKVGMRDLAILCSATLKERFQMMLNAIEIGRRAA